MLRCDPNGKACIGVTFSAKALREPRRSRATVSKPAMIGSDKPLVDLPPGHPACLVRLVASVFTAEPALEAVTINKTRHAISVATLGKPDEARLGERISRTLQEAQSESNDWRCGLLDGTTDCATCDSPLSPGEQQAITIKREGDTTTIARVTCPTARHFWRWRDIPLPKVVQRDVEFLESAEHIDEWKPQLAAAVFCGLFGLTAYWLGERILATPLFVLAYLAGG